MKGLNSRIEGTEKRICDLEDRMIKITQCEKERENILEKTNRQTKEQSLRQLDYNKRSNIHVTEVQKRAGGEVLE